MVFIGVTKGSRSWGRKGGGPISETGLNEGKMSGCTQSSVFSVERESRCGDLVWTPTTTVGFHKESASIQPLIPAAQGPGIVTLHAKFQLVLVPVVSLQDGCHISGTSTSYLEVEIRDGGYRWWGSERLLAEES